jgi:hypothetical protein
MTHIDLKLKKNRNYNYHREKFSNENQKIIK